MSKQEEKLERIYTVPLTRAWIAARHKRTKRAVNVLREFAEQHMKSSEIKIDTELNERLWNRGITRPPRKITVRMERDEDGVVTIFLPKEEKPAETPQEEVKEELALPERKEEALPPAIDEGKKEELAAPVLEKSPAKTKAPAKKKSPAKSAAAKKKPKSD